MPLPLLPDYFLSCDFRGAETGFSAATVATVAATASRPTPAASADPEPMTGQGQSASGLSAWSSTIFRHVRYENLVAGVSGGVLSNLALHPLDLVKIRFAELLREKNGYNAIKSYKTEGRAERLEATEYLISAAEAGAMTLCITNPLWVTKTRLMLQYDSVVNASQRQYKGMFDTLVKIYKYEGVRGLYKGFIPGLFGTSHGALQFMAYELLKLKYNQHINRLPEAQLSTVEYISVAALSKIFAVAATYPYQVIRARLQDQHMFYNGVLDVMTKTWRSEQNIQHFSSVHFSKSVLRT
ncbi:hypothetical protein E5288_WYG022397 [Bos mutus]|uniref:Mitochondrial folate transporter/carrier n=1 Tax=Bos mutus TaxID=72004 RepID=A0A6B0RWM1_9CETA|nr:hypothetical protein [Bos mutus]